MADHAELEAKLTARLAELTERAQGIEDDLRQPLDQDWEEQAVDLADDDALAGVDAVLRQEIVQVRAALDRIENGTYGSCANCGEGIPAERLEAQPVATRCVKCAA